MDIALSLEGTLRCHQTWLEKSRDKYFMGHRLITFLVQNRWIWRCFFKRGSKAQAKFGVRRLWIQFINGCHGHTLLPVHHRGCVCLEIKGARGDKGGAGCSGFKLIQVPKIEAECLWLEQWVLWVIPWFHLTSRAEISEVWKLRRCFPVMEDATFPKASLTGKV